MITRFELEENRCYFQILIIYPKVILSPSGYSIVSIDQSPFEWPFPK